MALQSGKTGKAHASIVDKKMVYDLSECCTAQDLCRLPYLVLVRQGGECSAVGAATLGAFLTVVIRGPLWPYLLPVGRRRVEAMLRDQSPDVIPVVIGEKLIWSATLDSI